MRSPTLVVAIISLSASAVQGQILQQKSFELARRSEVQAVVTARCPGCDWGKSGHEAAVLRLRVDGGVPFDLVLARGAETAEYAVALGPFAAGRHRLTVVADRAASAPQAGEAAVESVRVVAVPAPRSPSGRARVGTPELTSGVPDDDPAHLAAALSPILHPREDALRRFSDLPLVLWYEVDRTPRGRRFRYSVVFSNEDGGTPPDRLMATWGRLTDIEYVYGVEVDGRGRLIHEELQGREHKIVPFRGRRLGRHPLLFVVTENNMLDDKGRGRRRHALAAVPFDLTSVSREAVMDAHPWTYRLSSQEAAREGRVREDATPGSARVPDPRRFVYLEACAQVKHATLIVGVGTRTAGGLVSWHASDGPAAERAFRIARSPDHFPNGCFRSAVALPASTRDEDIAALRFRAYTRAPGKGEPPIPEGAATARLLKVNRLFRLDAEHRLGRDLFTWTGDLLLVVDGPPAEIPVAR